MGCLQDVDGIQDRVGKTGLTAVLPGVDRGGNAHCIAEDPGKIVAVGKAAGVGNESHIVIALLQQQLGVFHTDLVEIFAGGHAHMGAEGAGQIFLADMELLGQIAHAVEEGEVLLQDPQGGFHYLGQPVLLFPRHGAGAIELGQNTIGGRGGCLGADTLGFGGEAVQSFPEGVCAVRIDPAPQLLAAAQQGTGETAPQAQDPQLAVALEQDIQRAFCAEGNCLTGFQQERTLFAGEPSRTACETGEIPVLRLFRKGLQIAGRAPAYARKSDA